MTDMCRVAAGTHNSMTALFQTAVHVHCLLACVASKAFAVNCLLTRLIIAHAFFLRVRHAQSRVVLVKRACFSNQRTNNNTC